MALDPTKPAFAYPANNNACGGAYNPDMPPSVNPDTYCNPAPYYNVDTKRILAGVMNSIDPIMQASLGMCKPNEYVSGAGSSTLGRWFCAIHVLADTILNVGVGQTAEINGVDSTDVSLVPLSGVTLPAGTILYGNFSKVVLVSGLVKLMGHPTR